MITVRQWLAMAIEGPHSTAHVTRLKLESLRLRRWDMLSEQEQGERLAQADAAMAEYALIQAELR